MAGYLFEQEAEGSDRYRCRPVSERQIARLDSGEAGESGKMAEAAALVEARDLARSGVKQALFHGSAPWAKEMASRYAWVREDAEIVRYMRECVR